MSGLIAFATSAVLLIPTGGAVSTPPFDPCDSSITMVRRNYYAPEWCGKRDRAKYEEFRVAFEQYKAASDEAFKTEWQIQKALALAPCGNPGEVDLISVRIDQFSRPAVDRAAAAWNAMKAAQRSAFKGMPDAVGVEIDVDLLNDVIAALGRGNIYLESAAGMIRNAKTDEACADAYGALGYWSPEYAKGSVLQGTLVRAIEAAMKTTDEACAEFIIVDSMSPGDIEKKAGSANTKKVQGGALTFPKSFNVGKKPTKLPVSIKSPVSGYGTITLTRGSKGILATGGQVTKGSFGLLMIIPAKTKTGEVTVTFKVTGGPTIKAPIRLR